MYVYVCVGLCIREWSGVEKSSLSEFCLDSRCELIVCGKECGWHVEVLGGWLVGWMDG